MSEIRQAFRAAASSLIEDFLGIQSSVIIAADQISERSHIARDLLHMPNFQYLHIQSVSHLFFATVYYIHSIDIGGDLLFRTPLCSGHHHPCDLEDIPLWPSRGC